MFFLKKSFCLRMKTLTSLDKFNMNYAKTLKKRFNVAISKSGSISSRDDPIRSFIPVKEGFNSTNFTAFFRRFIYVIMKNRQKNSLLFAPRSFRHFTLMIFFNFSLPIYFNTHFHFPRFIRKWNFKSSEYSPKDGLAYRLRWSYDI